MLESITISISIQRNWKDLYEAIWRPEDFPKWASGLTKSPLIKEGASWKAEGPEGPITVRFTDHNEFGVMDHYVDLGNGTEIYVPLRVIPNSDGADVLLTLFRQAGMSNSKFKEDVDWVKRDFLTLKALVMN
ncbi:polyketide cyclase [Solimicrobium silvestre]|uniref:Polyketide cyclase / dehydrase and lipid transport n=1 Tax=Solimicrobium silvestre TaxID=2099400 RepID=A0A2S9GX85_9BURK|nr:polyketide cyclase [Solimicrobium silvestre]PRC92276.1 hypothetical protein S2091_2935 [Solimicrobium silvestre]